MQLANIFQDCQLNKEELALLASYIRGELPPSELKQTVKHEMFTYIHQIWQLVGISIDAFFRDTINPVTVIDDSLNSNISEGQRQRLLSLKKITQEKTQYFLSLSVILFQAESFLRNEARELGFPLAPRRSEILKQLACEECEAMVSLFNKDSDWESPSGRAGEDNMRTARAYMKGDISWENANNKSGDSSPQAQAEAVAAIKRIPLTCFCFEVFRKNKKHLPAFDFWLDSSFFKQRKLTKVGVFDGIPKKYLGRGEASKRKSRKTLRDTIESS